MRVPQRCQVGDRVGSGHEALEDDYSARRWHCTVANGIDTGRWLTRYWRSTLAEGFDALC